MMSVQRKALLASLAVTALIAASGSVDSGAAFAQQQPTFLYGKRISFDIFRSGSKIGTHTVEFAEDHDLLTVTAVTRMRIAFLFIPAYRFDYRSRETWIDGHLAEVTAKTDDNGKLSRVDAVAVGGRFKIKGPHGELVVDDVVFPTNHWNVAQVASNRVLNSITGQIAHVTVHSIATETVATAHGSILADRFEYSGDLHDTHVWYDSAGRWVKLSFKAADGSWIEFRCAVCTASRSAGEVWTSRPKGHQTGKAKVTKAE